MSAKVTEKAYQLEESDITERKAFLRSLIKRIEIDKDKATVHYHLPLPNNENRKVAAEVLPINTPGGPFGTVPELLFEREELIPTLQQLLVSTRDLKHARHT